MKKKPTSLIEIRSARSRVRPAKLVDRSEGRNGRPRNMVEVGRVSPFFKNILRYFIEPLVRSMDLGEEPDDKMNYGERISFLMGASYRDVVMAVAIEPFQMPGRKWGDVDGENPSDLIPGGPMDTRILKGTPLMVRIDERMPNRIDIERCDDSKIVGIDKNGNPVRERQPTRIFSLTNSEYKTIYTKLKEIAGLNERLVPPGEEPVR